MKLFEPLNLFKNSFLPALSDKIISKGPSCIESMLCFKSTLGISKVLLFDAHRILTLVDYSFFYRVVSTGA